MTFNERRQNNLFKTLRRLHGHNVDSAGLNDLTEAFANFMTRARYFSIGHLRRTWSHSAVEFMKYRRRLPALLAGGSEDEDLDKMGDRWDMTERTGESETAGGTDQSAYFRRVFVANVPSKVTTTQLASFFSKFGRVVSCSLPADRATSTMPRRSKGCAYVTFQTMDGMNTAVSATPVELIFYNKTMVVTPVAKLPSLKRMSEYGLALDENFRLSASVIVAAASAADDSENLASESEPDVPSSPSSPASLRASYETSRLLNMLPDKVLINIFTYLDIFDRIRAERVCKRWQEVSFESWSRIRYLTLRHSFNLNHNRALQNATLKAILHRCGPHLLGLDLSGSSHFLNDYSLVLVTEHCRQLTSVNLSGLKTHWKTLKVFAECCGSQLKSIIYRDAYFLGEKAFWWLFRGCPNLRSLDMSGSTHLTGKCFRLLGIDMESIRLDGCRRLLPLGIEELCLKSTDLRRLNLDDCSKINDSSLALISRSLPNLEYFSLRGGPFPGLTSAGLRQLKRLKALKVLHLDRNAAVDDSFINSIMAEDGIGANLHRFTLSSSGNGEKPLTRHSLASLKSCHHLAELDLSHLPAVVDDVLEILAVSLKTSLEILTLRGCTQVGDRAVSALSANCTNLRILDVSGCLAVTNWSVCKFFSASQHFSSSSSTTALTIIVGGTSCEMAKLMRLLERSSNAGRIILDSSDNSKVTYGLLRPPSNAQLTRGSSNEKPDSSDMFASFSDNEDDLNDEDDEFESLIAQRSFVLDELEEDDLLSDHDESLHNELVAHT